MSKCYAIFYQISLLLFCTTWTIFILSKVRKVRLQNFLIVIFLSFPGSPIPSSPASTRPTSSSSTPEATARRSSAVDSPSKESPSKPHQQQPWRPTRSAGPDVSLDHHQLHYETNMKRHIRTSRRSHDSRVTWSVAIFFSSSSASRRVRRKLRDELSLSLEDCDRRRPPLRQLTRKEKKQRHFHLKKTNSFLLLTPLHRPSFN